MLLIPALTTVSDGAFLADDTLLGGYELGGGWLRVERVKIGKHAFVGNSGMTAPGRKVPKQGLVAVLSAAPRRTQGQGGDLLARQPAHPAASRRRDAATTAAPTTRRPGSGWPARRRGGAPAGAGDGLSSPSGSGVVVRPGAARRPASWWAAAVLVGSGGDRGGSRGGGHHQRGEVAPRRARPQGGAPALELVRVAQRAGRHLRRGTSRRRGSPAPRPGPRSSTSGCAPLGARVGKGVWCETYWLPEADLVDLARRRDGQRGLRGADAPVPRPDAQHGHGHPASRGHPRPATA